MGAGKRKRAAPLADPTRDTEEPAGPALETRNEVTLVGRLAAPAEERTLPSGDLLVTWRLIVDRPAGGRVVPQGVRVSKVDTLDCVAWTAAARRSALALSSGSVVSVTGALRRRFWRAGAGAVSRCEVEVATVKPVRRRTP